jgi:glycerophosphoryl diester phosphodiesterase
MLRCTVGATTSRIVREVIRDFAASWRVLVQTDLIYKLTSFTLLTPAALLLLRWALSRTGTQVVADTEIATFFLTTRPGILSLIVVSAALTAITAVEMTSLMAIGLAPASGRRLTVRNALAFAASRSLVILRLTANIVTRLIVSLLPFAAVIGAAYWILLRNHDINFYLSQRPPEFWTALLIATVIVVALGIFLSLMIARWGIALPLVVFEGIAPRRALEESARRLRGHRSLTLTAVGVWAIIATALLAVATWVPDFIGRTLAPGFSGSLPALLGFMTGLALLWALLNVMAAVVNVSLLSLLLLGLYRHVAGIRNPNAILDFSEGWDGTRRLAHSAKIGLGLVSILVTFAVVFLMGNVARRNQQVLVIAHRGASAAAPENTMAAFRLGADLGADFVELDVQESADGEIVVVHDSDLMKVGGSPLKIWEAPAAALRAVDIGSRKGPQFAAERIPTLAEVFAELKGRVRVVVELKSYGHSQRLEERVVEIVEAAGAVNHTIFMSLDHDMVRRLNALRPSWTVGVLVAKAIGDPTTLGGDFLAVEASLATPAFVRRAHRAGQAVYVWTVNDPAWMLRSMANGVDGLITDRPDVARDVVTRRGAMSDAQRVLVALLVAMGAKTELLIAEEAVQPYTLAARAVLPARLSRLGTPPSGVFFSSSERATAAANGVEGPTEGPYLADQPLQGVSSMVPAGDATWWALSDNGFGSRANSADFQLVIHRLDPRWGDAVGPRVLGTTTLRDPDRHIPWVIVCDQNTGTPLPAFSFNVLPLPTSACGPDPSARILTGFDLDPESFVRAPDGTFWVSEEFGPFLLHVADDGRVLAPPVQIPGVRSPQNPFLAISGRGRAEAPTLATSRGFEGLAISPDGATLYALLEGAVSGDDPHDLRLYAFDVAHATLAPAFFTVRLDGASQTVDLASLTSRSDERIYPGASATPSGPLAIGELKAVNDRQLLLIERDNLGDDEAPPRVKKIFLLTLPPTREGAVTKTQLVDLLAIPDPAGLGGDLNFFRLPFYTIESVHVVDERTLLVASDNNFPFSNGRSRSRTVDRKGPFAADDTDIILIRLATPLDVDSRLRQPNR